MINEEKMAAHRASVEETLRVRTWSVRATSEHDIAISGAPFPSGAPIEWVIADLLTQIEEWRRAYAALAHAHAEQMRLTVPPIAAPTPTPNGRVGTLARERLRYVVDTLGSDNTKTGLVRARDRIGGNITVQDVRDALVGTDLPVAKASRISQRVARLAEELK